MDHLFDIVISADQSTCHWRDADQFAEGERALKRFLSGQSPFCDGWENCSPPGEWEIPALPAFPAASGAQDLRAV